MAGRLTLARNRILQEYPFYGRLLMRLSFGLAECETAYTDMRQIVFDPAFAGRLTDEELKFVLAHEYLHAGLGHYHRCQGREPYLWNVACDFVINGWLMEMHVGEFPARGELYDEELKGKSAEEI